MKQTRQINGGNIPVVLTPGEDNIRDSNKSKDQLIVVLEMDVDVGVGVRLRGKY